MAGINPNSVYAPSPDQSLTTGACACAPVGTTAPTDARSALGNGWDSSGYIGEAGLSVATTRGVQSLKDWSKSVVRNLKGDYDSTLNAPFIQIDEFSAKRIFGESNVIVTPATREHGKQINIAIGSDLPPVESYCYSMKDENRRVRVYVPRGQFVEVANFSFKPDEGCAFDGTLHTLDDGTGHSIYFMFDDGEIISG